MDLSNKAEVMGISLPLVFGDAKQIAVLRRLELIEDFKALPECDTCHGEKDCSKCGAECENCAGTGKLYSEWRKFKDAHPGFYP